MRYKFKVGDEVKPKPGRKVPYGIIAAIKPSTCWLDYGYAYSVSIDGDSYYNPDAFELVKYVSLENE